MSDLGMHIAYGTGVVLAACTAIRFLLQEAVAIVEQYKKLRETIRGDKPQLPPG